MFDEGQFGLPILKPLSNLGAVERAYHVNKERQVGKRRFFCVANGRTAGRNESSERFDNNHGSV